MTATEPDLLRAVLADPADDLARLVYADFLEEGGGPNDSERAEFIHLQIESHGKCSAWTPPKLGIRTMPDPTADGRCSMLIAKQKMLPSLYVGDWVRSQNNPETGVRINAVRLGGLSEEAVLGLETEVLTVPGNAVEAHELVATRHRASYLYRHHYKKWFEYKLDKTCFWATLNPNWIDDRVTRGFVSGVRTTLTALFGGPCVRCFEFGGRRVIENPNRRKYSSAIVICPTCDGSGVAPGAIESLFRTQPITRVEVTDAHPARGGELWGLPHDTLARLPFEVAEWLAWPPGTRGESWVSGTHGTPEAMLSELSRRCVDYGRHLAGLPQLPDSTDLTGA